MLLPATVATGATRVPIICTATTPGLYEQFMNSLWELYVG